MAGCLHSGCALAQLHPKPLCRCKTLVVSMHSKGYLGEQDAGLQLQTRQRQAKCGLVKPSRGNCSLPHQAPYVRAVMQPQRSMRGLGPQPP